MRRANSLTLVFILQFLLVSQNLIAEDSVESEVILPPTVSEQQTFAMTTSKGMTFDEWVSLFAPVKGLSIDEFYQLNPKWAGVRGKRIYMPAGERFEVHWSKENQTDE